MYWLLDIETQNRVQDAIIELQKSLIEVQGAPREQAEQIFPFVGRKSREVSRRIISHLTKEGEVVCDPFSGSGTFAYAANDSGRHVLCNEWEPFANRLSMMPFEPRLSDKEFKDYMSALDALILDKMKAIYKTKCPSCGNEMMFDGLFFDRSPEEYYSPTRHARMGPDGENVIYRGAFKCPCCGNTQAHYSSFDEEVRLQVESMQCDFPSAELIENSRINFTSPYFTQYGNLFSKRQKVALCTLRDGILSLPSEAQPFFYSVFLAMIHLGKYVDYHSKSQDNHCPDIMLKETNLYHRFRERAEKHHEYLRNQPYPRTPITVGCLDFRDFLASVDDGQVSLLMTDPPYGDNAQYFEQAQRVHPFMGYSLKEDRERLKREVVISNAPSRPDKSSHEQLFNDYESLFEEAFRVVKKHGYMVMYFRPKQSDWIRDLNELKDIGRRHGFEPLLSVALSNEDPSMRVLASAAWAFSKDVCFIFLRLDDEERRWYEDGVDVDELVYLAAVDASGGVGNGFLFRAFQNELTRKLRSKGLLRITSPEYRDRITKTLSRYTVQNGATYHLQPAPPYDFTSEMSAEMRAREYAPIVVEELDSKGEGFTFEDFVIRLSSYIENGSREVIQSLHNSNKLIPELLLKYATEDRQLLPFRAYFQIEESAAQQVRSCNLNFGNGNETTTAIKGLGLNAEPQEIYDLHGRRVTQPKKGELYIIGGKKKVY